MKDELASFAGALLLKPRPMRLLLGGRTEPTATMRASLTSASTLAPRMCWSPPQVGVLHAGGSRQKWSRCSADTKPLAGCADDCSAGVWRRGRGGSSAAGAGRYMQVASFCGHADSVMRAAWSPDGRMVASGTRPPAAYHAPARAARRRPALLPSHLPCSHPQARRTAWCACGARRQRRWRRGAAWGPGAPASWRRCR